MGSQEHGGGRERRKVERQEKCGVTSNLQPPSTGLRLWLELETMLLIQCLFTSYNKKIEVLCNYPIPNEINIPWHFPVNGEFAHMSGGN